MSMTVGQLAIKIGLDTSQLDSQMKSVEGKAKGLGNVFQNAFSVAGGIIIAKGLAAVTGGLQTAIGAATGFEKQMSGVEAILKPTASAMEDLRAKALELGSSTSWSASEAAAGIEMLARNGLDAQTIMDGTIDATLALASATGTDLPNAANIATDVMANFGLGADQMVSVIDNIAGLTATSKFAIDDFRLALGQAGGIAGNAGVSFNEMTTALSIMSPSFKSGAEAGTALRNIIMNLNTPTGSAAVKLKELGLYSDETGSAFNNLDGTLKPMPEVMQMLNDRLEEVPVNMRGSYLAAIGMREGVAGLNNMLAMSTDEWAELGATIADTSAAEIAKIRMDNLQGAMTQMGSATEGLMITLGALFLPILTKIVQGSTHVISKINELTTAFINSEQGKAAIQAIGAAFDSFGAMIGPMFDSLVEAIPGFIANLKSGFSKASEFMQPLISAVQVTIQQIVSFWNSNGSQIVSTAQGIFQNVVSVVQSVLPQVISFVSGVLSDIVNFWNTHGASMVASAQQTFSMAANTVQQYLPPIQSLVQSILTNIVTFWNNNGSEILSTVATAWNSIQTIIQTVLSIIQSTVIPILTAIAAFIANHSAEIQQILTSAWNIMKTVITTVLGVIQSILSAVLAAVQGDWSTAWENIKTAFSTAINGVLTIAGNILNAIAALFGTTVEGIISTWSSNFKRLPSFVTSGLSAARKAITGALRGLVDAAKGLGKGIIDGIVSAIRNAGSAITSALWGTVENAISWVKGKLKIDSPSRMTYEEIGEPLIMGIAEGILRNADRIVDAMAKIDGLLNEEAAKIASDMREIFSGIADSVSQLYRDVLSGGSSVIDIFDTGLDEQIKDLKQQSQDLFDEITGATEELNNLPRQFEEQMSKARQDYQKERADILSEYAPDELNPEVVAEKNRRIAELDSEFQANYMAMLDERAQAEMELQQRIQEMYRESGQLNQDISEATILQQRKHSIAEQAQRDLQALQKDVTALAQTDPIAARELYTFRRDQILELADLEQQIADATHRTRLEGYSQESQARLQFVKDQFDLVKRAQELELSSFEQQLRSGAASNMESIQSLSGMAEALDRIIRIGEIDFPGMGAAAIQGIAEGVKSEVGYLQTTMIQALDQALEASRQRLQARSPSMLFADMVGAPIAQGIATGINKNRGLIGNAVGQSVNLTLNSNISIRGSSVREGSVRSIVRDEFNVLTRNVQTRVRR